MRNSLQLYLTQQFAPRLRLIILKYSQLSVLTNSVSKVILLLLFSQYLIKRHHASILYQYRLKYKYKYIYYIQKLASYLLYYLQSIVVYYIYFSYSFSTQILKNKVCSRVFLRLLSLSIATSTISLVTRLVAILIYLRYVKAIT